MKIMIFNFRVTRLVKSLLMEPLNRLFKFAAVGFVACTGSYYLFQNSVSKLLINSEVCKDAIESIKNHNGAKLFLGEPIEAVKAKFARSENDTTKSVEMNVSGPKSKGIAFLTINNTQENGLKLSAVQLQIGEDDSKRLEIKSQVAGS